MKRSIKLTAAAVSAIMFWNLCPILSWADGGREILVTNSDELLAALADVKAGDEIILREGLYQNDVYLGDGIWSAFYGKADGTPEQHIILRSEDPEHPATVAGVTQTNKVALKIVGDYWEIRDLKICEAAKGIFLLQSEHSVISGCEVYNTGAEAIHITDNSSYNLVENCYVHDSGTDKPQYGEGVYIGSAKNNTDYGFESHYNTVRNCRFGPNIAADHVDIKEFTYGNVVENCTFDGTGIQGQNGGDSFVEVKGNNCIIRNNTGWRYGCEAMKYAFDANVQLDGWGQNNLVYGNTVYLDTTDCYLFKAWDCEAYVFRNTVEPADVTCYGNLVVQPLDIFFAGDVNEDIQLNDADVRRMQDYLFGKDTGYFSAGNAELTGDETLDAFDLCALKRKLLTDDGGKPEMSVKFVKEEEGSWRMSDGLGGKSLTFHVSAEAGTRLNMACGYWDPNSVNPKTGQLGVWTQLHLGMQDTDENGKVAITVELPEAVTRVALEIWDYLAADGTELDKADVVLEKAVVVCKS